MNGLSKTGRKVVIQMSILVHPSMREIRERPGALPLQAKGSPEQGL